jgi:hypothetical protein
VPSLISLCEARRQAVQIALFRLIVLQGQQPLACEVFDARADAVCSQSHKGMRNIVPIQRNKSR